MPNENVGYYKSNLDSMLYGLHYGNPYQSKMKTEPAITMFTVKDIQAIFKCGQKQSYELVNSNGFPAIKIGGKILVEKKALEQWLDKNKGKTIFL